jgi:hypothetical protein
MFIAKIAVGDASHTDRVLPLIGLHCNLPTHISPSSNVPGCTCLGGSSTATCPSRTKGRCRRAAALANGRVSSLLCVWDAAALPQADCGDGSFDEVQTGLAGLLVSK